MLSQAAPYLFWLGICGFAGAALYSELLDRDPANEPFGDGAYGDDPFIAPDDLKLLHGTPIITGGK